MIMMPSSSITKSTRNSRIPKQRTFTSSNGSNGNVNNNTTTTNNNNNNSQKIIDNTGSIARDVLAAERTFLAWSRTGLGFCGAGSALLAAYHNNNNNNQESVNSVNSWSREDQEPQLKMSRANDDSSRLRESDSSSSSSTTDGASTSLSSYENKNNYYRHYWIPIAAGLLVGNGGFLLIFATRRYIQTTWLLRQNKFLCDPHGTLGAVLVTATSTLVSMGLVGSFATTTTASSSLTT